MFSPSAQAQLDLHGVITDCKTEQFCRHERSWLWCFKLVEPKPQSYGASTDYICRIVDMAKYIHGYDVKSDLAVSVHN